MADKEDPVPFSLLALLGLKPFGVRASVMLYLSVTVLWLGCLSLLIGTDLFSMRPLTQDEINAARWQKSSDPNQIGKNTTQAPNNQGMGINDLFRPQPNGINPFDATRHAQASAPILTADWPMRIQTGLIMGSVPLIGLIGVILFARYTRMKEQEEADARQAERTRQEEEKHRARRRGKGIPMRRLR